MTVLESRDDNLSNKKKSEKLIYGKLSKFRFEMAHEPHFEELTKGGMGKFGSPKSHISPLQTNFPLEFSFQTLASWSTHVL